MLHRHTLCATTALSIVAFSALAMPQGGVVSAGSAIITQGAGLTTIRQGTDRASIDWGSFNVGAGERVDFKQPCANAITLNRIHDQNPSSILGSITANGQVILANPNGMIFGKGSSIDVGGLVASTAGISDAAFMQGGTLPFDRAGNPNATIAANGTISIKEGGLAALVAPRIVNNGWIDATLGRIQLAGAETFTADLHGDGLISLALSDRVKHTLVENAGTLVARAGHIVLTAAQAGAIISSAVNISGVVDASASMMDAAGTVTFGNGIGGDIAATAKHLTVASDAALNASGPKGGGTITLGGGWQGTALKLGANATTNMIARGATLKANATHKGDGGTVVAWSDGTTVFDGAITATGGAFGGNGGHIETSGKMNLGLTGSADASSAWGKAGEWLLDPRNVVIQNNAQPGVENTIAAGGGTLNAATDTFLVSAESISTALAGGNNVTITTGSTGAQNGDITLDTATITKNAGGDATLTLKADGSILTLNTNSITSGSGKLHTIFWSNADAAGEGRIHIQNTTIQTNGGDIVLAGGLDDGANGSVAGDGRPDGFGFSVNDPGIIVDIFGLPNILSQGGAILARGMSGNSNGVLLQADNNVNLSSGGGNFTVHGVGSSGASLSADRDAMITSGAGLFSITGSATNGGYGIAVSSTRNGLVKTDGGDMVINAASDAVSHAIFLDSFSSPAALTTHGGDLSITATAPGVGLDVSAIDIVDLSGGDLHLTGISSGLAPFSSLGSDPQHFNVGLYIAQWPDLSTVGNVTLAGSSANAPANDFTAGIMTSDLAGSLGTLSASHDVSFVADTINSLSVEPVYDALGNPVGYSGIDFTYDAFGNPVGFALNHDAVKGPEFGVQTPGVVTFAPYSAATSIGVAGGLGTLQVTDTLLNTIDAGKFIIGRSDGTGNISIGGHLWDDPVEFRTAGGIIDLLGPQTGLAGTDASMTFSGYARTYYAIDFTGTTGTGVIFNGPREEKKWGANGGDLYVPSPGAPSTPVPLPPTPPKSPPGISFPTFYATDKALVTLIRTQDRATVAQVAQTPAFSNFIFDEERFDLRHLYTLSPDLEDELN